MVWEGTGKLEQFLCLPVRLWEHWSSSYSSVSVAAANGVSGSTVSASTAVEFIFPLDEGNRVFGADTRLHRPAHSGSTVSSSTADEFIFPLGEGYCVSGADTRLHRPALNRWRAEMKEKNVCSVFAVL